MVWALLRGPFPLSASARVSAALAGMGVAFIGSISTFTCHDGESEGMKIAISTPSAPLAARVSESESTKPPAVEAFLSYSRHQNDNDLSDAPEKGTFISESSPEKELESSEGEGGLC